MDYYLLTDLAARVGYHLALSGAETFRVEETIRRIIGAYGIECEAFSIPNCVMVSLEAANGKPLMVMKRVDFHGNDLESVEKLNALRAASAPKRLTRASPRSGSTKRSRGGGTTRCPFITWQFLRRGGLFARCLAARYATACSRAFLASSSALSRARWTGARRTRFSAPSSRRSPWRCRRISPRASIWSTISTLSSSAP